MRGARENLRRELLKAVKRSSGPFKWVVFFDRPTNIIITGED